MNKTTASDIQAMPAMNPSQLRARMAAAGSGFGAACPECKGDVAPMVLETFGACMKCR